MNKKTNTLLASTLDNISDGIVTLDNNWCYTYLNKKAGEILGRSPGSLIGKHIWTEFPDVVGLPFHNAYYKAKESQQTQYVKEYYQPFDKWFENRIYPSPDGLAIYFTDITERIKIENLLIESERNLDNIINNIGDPLFVKDDQSHLLIVNDAFCKMFNLSRADIIGKTLAENVTPEEQEIFLRLDKQVLSSGIENINEESLTIRENETRIISTKKTRYVDKKGTNFLIGTIRDITDKKKAEANNQMLLSLIETSDDFIGLASLEGKPIYLNELGKKMIGIETDEDLPNNIAHFFPEHYQSVIENEHLPTITKKNKWQGESLFKNFKTGDLIPVEMSGFLIRDNITNKPLALGVIASNITNRKMAEVKLQESEKSLLEAQKIAKIGSFNISLNKEIAETSISFNEIIGVAKDTEVTLNVWKNIVHPEDKSLIKETVLECQKQKRKFDLEYRIITKNKKELKWIHGLGEVIYIDGLAVSFFGTIQDITARKQAELEFKAAKDFSENLILNLNEGLSVVNIDGMQIEANPAFCKMLGYKKEELIGQKVPFNYWPPEEYDKIQDAFSKTLKGEHSNFELTLMRKNGERFPVLIATSSVRNNNGDTIANFATIQDISERVKVQKRLESSVSKSILKKNVILELSSLVGSGYHKALDQITALSASTLNVARVGVWKFNLERTSITCEKLYVLETGECETGAIINRSDNPEYFDALADNQTVNVEDAVNNNITKGFAKSYLDPLGVTSMLDVFIQGSQGMYGVICFEHIGDKRKWSADDEEFASSIASIVTLMVESEERKVAEENLVLINKKLSKANTELNKLREELEQENVYLRNELDLVFNYEEMVYGSDAFSAVLTEVEKVAPTNATVLLLGESGTGKELLARAVHNTGARNNKPLIKVNCSAIPRELIESELFGHKKGSFTGAVNDKIGKLELADGGTLFLDEIGDLPLDMQPKILRFLQEGEIEVVGGVSLKKLDVRVIAATNRNLKKEVKKKKFREDLYFRLNVFPIAVPPLRDRKDDIPILVEHFVDKFNKAYDKTIKYIPEAAMSQLIAYNWPGNIRELENLIERALILSTSSSLLIPGFETSVQKDKQLISSKDSTLNTVQRNHIIQILEQCDWKISGINGAAVMLDLKPSTLRDKMAKLKIFKPLKK